MKRAEDIRRNRKPLLYDECRGRTVDTTAAEIFRPTAPFDVNHSGLRFVLTVRAMRTTITKAPISEPASWDRLYDHHHAKVLRLSRALLADDEEAREVAQDVLMKAYQRLHLPEPPQEWDRWLSRVTVNACHDKRRSAWWKWRRRNSDDLNAIDPQWRGLGPEEKVAAREEFLRIQKSFSRLPARQREIFILRYFEQWSTSEIADSLGITAGAVKRHLFRAVQRLRGALTTTS